MNQQKARERRAWQREMGRYGVKMNDSCELPAGADGLLIRPSPVQQIRQSASRLWTVFLCAMAIWNESPDAIQLAKCFLRLPWSNERFELIEDPETAGEDYCLPDCAPYCKRSDAINHHFLSGKRMLPGECIRGELLGRSMDPIPERFAHHSVVEGTIVIVDQSGREFAARSGWLVERSQRTAAQKKRYWETEKSGSILEREPGSSPAVRERKSVVPGGGVAGEDPRDAHERLRANIGSK